MSFENTDGEFVTIKTPKEYKYDGFISFLQLDDGFVVSLPPRDGIENKFIRQNMFKFNEKGEIDWVVGDKYEKIWKPYFENKRKEGIYNSEEDYNKVLDRFVETPFQNVYYTERFPKFEIADRQDKIIADESTGNYYSVDVHTGEVEFIKAVRD